MNPEIPYYKLYVKETEAHNACALREKSLLKDVEFSGREMERMEIENQSMRIVIRACIEEMKYSAIMGQPISYERREFRMAAPFLGEGNTSRADGIRASG